MIFGFQAEERKRAEGNSTNIMNISVRGASASGSQGEKKSGRKRQGRKE